ncbi:MAG: pirin family protein [Alphaproteobacteria bacterium]|nr:pirin family protein [Alphaproteobacteria bacterium]
MIEVRPFQSLGRFSNEWLTARYHFSFAQYRDSARMGLGPLRVWNDDRVLPGRGFDPHPHRDMEIVTYVRQGAITHRDHLGNVGRTAAGDVQVMSAGTGITHGEHNLEDQDTTLFQIWIEPARTGVAPAWQMRAFPKAERASRLVALASGRASDLAAGALPIHQDATLYGATLVAGQGFSHELGAGRRAYLVAARGRFRVNGAEVGERDGVALEGEPELLIEALADGELLLADLP